MIKKMVIVFSFLAYTAVANECVQCHHKKMQQCTHSLHYTLSKAINITREAWGVHGSNVTLQTLPEPKGAVKTPADLVDDFLRRKCLRCHLQSRQINSTGNLCLACHNSHRNKIDAFKAKATMAKCLKCHNNEFVGSDYLGLFPHDYDRSYRSPITKKGLYPDSKYGIDQHHLISDIHYRRGLTCIDCHNKKHVKGGASWDGVVSCRSCHKHISKKYHNSYHKNIACSTCHSAWSMNNYELNVLRDDTPHYKQWSRLAMQEDPYLQHFLQKALRQKNSKIAPIMQDYVDNTLKPGIWYSGWLFRRWENIYLINGANNKVMIARPMFQYHISYKDKNGKMILNNVTKRNKRPIEVWLPYTPHTIIKQAKSCEMCHENLLQQKDIKENHILENVLIPTRIINGSFLTQKQLNQLHSQKYRIIRARELLEPQ